ncbi:MAG: ABC transporter ATP-binding protein [Deltaproteobacteria bacterium]|nr:ABC transporter ATP-binding protein [Deltaproteobacteria bacterium]
MLELDNVEVVYNKAARVLKGLSLRVPAGRIVALLGANGAGKSTVLKAVSGLLRAENGVVSAGGIKFLGKKIVGKASPAIVRDGIIQVMEGRRVFKELNVTENLRVGTHARRGRFALKAEMEVVFNYFPRLSECRRRSAGSMSGGEQQMLAIGRALMARPMLMMLDEPSLGLAPLLVRELFDIIRRINQREGITILLVEQNANPALQVADYGYFMEGGRVVLAGDGVSLRGNPEVKGFYLGRRAVARESAPGLTNRSGVDLGTG